MTDTISTANKSSNDEEVSLSARILAAYIRLVLRTSRRNPEFAHIRQTFSDNEPLIVAGWHGGFLLAPTLIPDPENMSAIVARHGDAELIGGVLAQFGVRLVRGAGAGGKRKDKGGAYALRMALRELKDGRSISMTADVPPGPARHAGLGIITLARLSGRPILPAAAATSRFITLNTWSRFVVNLPYSKLSVRLGEPLYVPHDADGDQMEALRQELQKRLNELNASAYRQVGVELERLGLPGVGAPPKPGLQLWLYSLGMSLLAPLARPLLRYRERRGKEDGGRLHERMGRPVRPRPAGRLIWVHAASVGETNAVLPLIARLKTEEPKSTVLLTTGTTTSARIASDRLPEGAIHQFVPLDVPLFVRRFLDHWQPDLGLFVESEIWPNLVLESFARHVPLVLLNARISGRSYRRWRKQPSMARPLFGRFDLVLTQNNSLREKFYRLGAPHVEVSGNLKMDTPPLTVDHAQRGRFRASIGHRPLFLAASTHPGEEEQVLAAHAELIKKHPKLLTIIVPRHPERGEEVAALAEKEGRRCILRSKGRLPEIKDEIYIADTLGELGLFYSVAPVAFIGGSLVSHGGQNPIEAIMLGASVVAGPHTFNFGDFYGALLSAKGSIRVENAAELANEVGKLLDDEQARAALLARGQAALLPLTGALDRTLEALRPYLKREDADTDATT